MNKRHYEHTLPNIRGSLSNTYVGNEEAVNKLLEENLDEDGNPRPLKKGGKRNNGGVDWRELV